jgi:hypothetical protein
MYTLLYGKNLFLTSMHIPMAVLNKGNSNATFQIDVKMRRILMTTWVGEAWERFTGPMFPLLSSNVSRGLGAF